MEPNTLIRIECFMVDRILRFVDWMDQISPAPIGERDDQGYESRRTGRPQTGDLLRRQAAAERNVTAVTAALYSAASSLRSRPATRASAIARPGRSATSGSTAAPTAGRTESSGSRATP